MKICCYFLELHSNYTVVNNACVKKIKNCISYNTNGSCKSCLFNHILINNACIKKIHNCASYNTNGSCKSCISTENHIIKQSLKI